MVLMERIVRPHLPNESGPSKTAAKCREPEENKVVKFEAPSGGGFNTKDEKPPKQPGAPKKPTEKTRNSSWSHAYKKYMTKKEKETEKCQEGAERIIGDGQATDEKAPPQPSGGGLGGGSGGGGSGEVPVG